MRLIDYSRTTHHYMKFNEIQILIKWSTKWHRNQQKKETHQREKIEVMTINKVEVIFI